MKKNLLKSNKGVTLMSLIVTIVIMAILAGVSVRSLTGSKGLINQAKETKNAAQMKDLEEQIELAIVKAEGKSNNVTMDDVIQQLIQDGVISSETQVDQNTGNITIDDYVWEGKLANYIMTDEETYYGNANAVATDQKYFTFTVDESTKTATITGIKDEYAVKAYYDEGNGTVHEDCSFNCAINDNGTYITDVVIPYEYVDESGNKYTVTDIGDSAFGPTYSNNGYTETVGFYAEQDYMFTSFLLPNTVQSIGKYAFANGLKLKNINIPIKVKSVGSGAFLGCKNLTSISMPSVTSIEYGTFEGCASLSSASIPSVTSIGISTFRGCISLKSINISSSVTSIEYAAFVNCTSLSNINIPDSVTSIGGEAFHGCTSLSSINIPDSVTTIGGGAFYGWTESQIINCEILEANKPSGWGEKWDYYDYSTARKATLNWGVSM